MPDSSLGNMLAIQGNVGSGELPGLETVNDVKLRRLLRSFSELERLDRKGKIIDSEDASLREDDNDIYVRSIPSTGNEFATDRMYREHFGKDKGKYGNWNFPLIGNQLEEKSIIPKKGKDTYTLMKLPDYAPTIEYVSPFTNSIYWISNI